MKLALSIFLGATALLGLMAVLRRGLRRKREVCAAVAAWHEAGVHDKVEMMARRCAEQPLAAVNWYLLACAHLRRGDIAAAAQYFGKAYHADWRLESAALMTFACLKATAGERGVEALRDQIMTTWREMGRPELGRSRTERRILAALQDRRAGRGEAVPVEQLPGIVLGL